MSSDEEKEAPQAQTQQLPTRSRGPAAEVEINGSKINLINEWEEDSKFD